MFAACADPLRFRQREQWQYWKKRHGGRIAYATAPQLHEPAMVLASFFGVVGVVVVVTASSPSRRAPRAGSSAR